MVNGSVFSLQRKLRLLTSSSSGSCVVSLYLLRTQRLLSAPSKRFYSSRFLLKFDGSGVQVKNADVFPIPVSFTSFSLQSSIPVTSP